MDKNALLDAFAEALANAAGEKGLSVNNGFKATGFPSGTPQGPMMGGPNGLWSTPGVERDIISTRVRPKGLAGALPARGTNTMHPFFAYLTGFSSPTGTNPDGVCDDPMTAGPMYNCHQTAQFGRYSYQTRELELNSVGQINNRSEPLDLRIINDPLLAPGVNGNGIVAPNVGAAGALRREVLTRMIELGITFQDKMMHQLWQGNPVNNTGHGGYREFPGLDILIGTSKVDAFTGVSCPALASDVKNFNYARVTDQTASGDIVNVLTYMLRYLNSIAEDTGMAPTEFALVMRRELFYELTAVWPCSYLTYRCAPRDGAVVSFDAGDQIAMRDSMRNEEYIMIDGTRIRVILDSAIDEENSGDTNRITNGSFASNIYFVPLSVRGGLSTLYWEYFDFTNGPMEAVQDGNLGQWYWTDGGRYFWHVKPPINWCVQWLAKIEPRLVLLTPHLAGKLLHVQYSPLQHTRDPFIDDPYFVGGGNTSMSTAPSFYAEWSNRG